MAAFNVGIVGYGWAAGAHIEAINSGKLGRVTRVCSSRALDAAELSAKHGCPIATHRDYAEFLAAPDLDVVSVCSYHSLHREHVVEAARAGKHIICEKPLALHLEDLRAIESTLRSSGVRLCVCFELRFSAQFRAVKSLIDQGWLGRLHYGEVDYYHGIGPWYPGFKWYTVEKESVSSLVLAGGHAMDILLLCMGSEVEEVFSFAARSSNEAFRPYEYPTTSVTLLRFAGGAVGKVASVVDCLQPYYFHTHLVGSDGTLLDDKFYSGRVEGLDRGHWSKLPYRPVDSGDVTDHPYQEQFDAFFEALSRGEDMPLAGLRDAVATHEVIFAADRSWKEGRPVRMSEIRPPARCGA